MDNPWRVKYVIPKRFIGHVYDQHDEPVCMAIATTNMIMIVYRMNGYNNLELSPQAIIDSGHRNLYDVCYIITNPEQGLQAVQDDPMSMIRTKDKFEVTMDISYEEGRKYHIYGILPSDLRLKEVVVSNFGKKYPMLAALKLGRLVDPLVAKEAYETPYEHPLDDLTKLEDETLHVVLIVGINTKLDREQDHYCVIKNCHGEEWGKEGLTKVKFSVFIYVARPIFNQKEFEALDEVSKNHT